MFFLSDNGLVSHAKETKQIPSRLMFSFVYACFSVSDATINKSPRASLWKRVWRQHKPQSLCQYSTGFTRYTSFFSLRLCSRRSGNQVLAPVLKRTCLLTTDVGWQASSNPLGWVTQALSQFTVIFPARWSVCSTYLWYTNSPPGFPVLVTQA